MEGGDWLLHEAFCLYRDRDIFEPYEKHHSTVKEACELAKGALHPPTLCYGIRRTNTWRSAPYIRLRAREYYDGNLLVPDDGKSSRCKRAVYAAFVYTDSCTTDLSRRITELC